MELESSLSTGLVLESGKRCCQPSYHSRWVRNKGALLILCWSFLTMSVVHYYVISGAQRGTLSKGTYRPADNEVMGLTVLLLIGGWLADAFFGRYRLICCGMWLMWIGALLSTISIIVSEISEVYKNDTDRYVALLSSLIMGVGFGLYQANIVQFGIDQLSDASSMEITNFITCYILTFFANSLIMFFSTKCTPDYVGVLVLTLCLSLALCLYFFFNHWLLKDQIIQNPLPLIWKVLRYCIKNNHLQRRFSFFKSKGILSRLDIAKTMYTGPFSSEKVEDVKTFFRVLVVIASCTWAHTGVTSISTVLSKIQVHLDHWPSTNMTSNCFERLSIVHIGYMFVIVVVIAYMTIVQPALKKYVPSITTKFIIALVLFLIRILSLLAIESASYYYQRQSNSANIIHCYSLLNSTKPLIESMHVDIYWTIIPKLLNGLALFFLLLAAMEFVCAQVPFNMKGLVFGLAYAMFGFGTVIHTAISYPFLYAKENVWDRAPLTCGIWYFLIQAVIAIAGLVVMVIAIKKYKKRERIDMFHSDWQDTDSEE